MQGLEEDSVNHTLHTLTKPVELDIQSQTSEVDDGSCNSDLTPERVGQTDAAGPGYDPLEQCLTSGVKSRRHAEDPQMSSDACEYVLVDLSEDVHSENLSDVKNIPSSKSHC